MKDLTSLRAAAEKATPGPYSIFTDDGVAHSLMPSMRAGDICTFVGCGDYEQRNRNARYLQLANPATVLELLDEVEAYRADGNALLNLATRWQDRAVEAESALTASQARAGELEGHLTFTLEISEMQARLADTEHGRREKLLRPNQKRLEHARAALTGGGGEGFRSARDHEPDTCAATSQERAPLEMFPNRPGDPVAWRVKDFADGWFYYGRDQWVEADRAQHDGALVEPLYLGASL